MPRHPAGMQVVHALVLGMFFSSAAAAQRTHVHDCREVLTNLERFISNDIGQVRVVARLERALHRLFDGDVRVQLGVVTDGSQVLLRGNGEQAATLASVLTELRRPDLQQLRVQCTLVSMPQKTAASCGLVPGQPTPVDEGQAGKVLKAAIVAKGSLRNLPETGGLPLQPFVFEHAQDPRRLRVEALPLAEGEACFTMQLVDGKLPADRTLLPDRKLFDVAVQLKVGGGAMVMAQQGEQATVVWIRFMGTRKAEPLADGAPARPGK